jgi:hypothetical protein
MRLIRVSDTMWINPERIVQVRVFRGEQPPHLEILLQGRDKGLLCDLTLDDLQTEIYDAQNNEALTTGAARAEGMKRAGLG